MLERLFRFCQEAIESSLLQILPVALDFAYNDTLMTRYGHLLHAHLSAKDLRRGVESRGNIKLEVDIYVVFACLARARATLLGAARAANLPNPPESSDKTPHGNRYYPQDFRTMGACAGNCDQIAEKRRQYSP